MIRFMYTLTDATVLGAAWTATDDDKKETKLTGTVVCEKSQLKQTPKSSNVLQVKEGGKTVNPFLLDKGMRRRQG